MKENQYTIPLVYSVRYRLGRAKKVITEIFESLLFERKIQQIKELKNSRSGRCFVIGNGPSLNQMDLDLMRNDFVICSNSFFLKFGDLNFKPNIITVEDHLVAEDNSEALGKLDGITKVFPIDLRHTLETSADTYFIELRRAWNNRNGKNKESYKFNVDTETFYWGGTVLYMNLQLAAYLGFDEIYLIGVDLTYKIPENAIIKGSVITSTSDDPNHFNPTYFGKGKRWHLPETERMQMSFTNAYEELKKSDIQLFNATVGGNLKDIPRVDYNSLFE